MAAVLASLGTPTAAHLRYAEELRQSLSSRLQAAAHEPLDATALVLALLLSPDESLRTTQLAGLDRRAALGVQGKTAALWPEVARLAVQIRLPLVHLALPALRRLDADHRWQLFQVMKWLIESDGRFDLFELSLQRLIRRRLGPHADDARSSVVRYASLEPIAQDCRVTLSALAHAGGSQASDIASAFSAGVDSLRLQAPRLELLSAKDSGLELLDAALDRLALAAPAAKKVLLEACVDVAGADGVIERREAELLRAIADSLECPIPPFVESEGGQPSPQRAALRMS
jgi:uncharacterized tellurite resistance protein B-like protein